MRVAVFGAGGWGKNHVRTFCSILGEDAVVVCDPDPARLDAVRSSHPGIETCDRPRFEGVDAIIVAAPAALHYELTREALTSGLHVLVEKPIALTVTEAQELVRLADAQELILMVDHLLEYHPAIVRLKELTDEGRFGRLLHLTSRRLNLGVIRTEENALWSLAPHDISVILRLLDEEPIEVSAHGATCLQEGIPDVVHVSLWFSSGVLGHVHVSWLDPAKVRELTVVGEEAMVIFDDVGPDRLTVFDAKASWAESRYVSQRKDASVLDLPPSEPLRRVAEAFLESVETGRPPMADGADGLRVVRVLEAAQRSLDAGGAAVRIDGEP